MSRVLDQQFVAHIFAPARGPDADACVRALDEIWRGCGLQFRMTEPIPGTDLPRLPSGIRETLPADGEIALAAQERPAADCQAVLRLHHDLLNLSIALAPPEASAPEVLASGEQDWPWWRTFDSQWGAITGQHVQHLLGEARFYLARVDAEADIQVAAPALYESLSRLLPAGAAGPQSQSTGVARPDGLALWETSTGPDERALRRFVLAIAPGADRAASAWVWSQGDPVIPPLARYLLHSAKLRYEMRVWQRDGQARQLRTSLDELSAELARLGAAEPVKAELLRLTRLNATLLHAGRGTGYAAGTARPHHLPRFAPGTRQPQRGQRPGQRPRPEQRPGRERQSPAESARHNHTCQPRDSSAWTNGMATRPLTAGLA